MISVERYSHYCILLYSKFVLLSFFIYQDRVDSKIIFFYAEDRAALNMLKMSSSIMWHPARDNNATFLRDTRTNTVTLRCSGVWPPQHCLCAIFSTQSIIHVPSPLSHPHAAPLQWSSPCSCLTQRQEAETLSSSPVNTGTLGLAIL